MQCGYCVRGGAAIGVDGINVTLINLIFKEQCTMYDILAIRLIEPDSLMYNPSIEVITKKTMEIMRIAHNKKPSPYFFSFKRRQLPIFKQFFQNFLSEICRYKGSEGILKDGWWTWPEEQASEKVNGQSAAEPAEKAAVPPEAAPTDAAAALSEADVERAIQSRVTEEKQKKGPACPECGCTSIFADKDADGVIITCLNCGCQWRPGQHRSW